MATIHILVGLPASGKSTWRAQHIKTNPDAVTVSTDDMIEEYAAEKGLTYTEAFSKVDFKSLNTRFKYAIKEAVSAGKDLIVDRTNMTVKGRRELMRLAEGYEAHAVVFVVPDDVLKARLKARAESTGKYISPMVINSMAKSYVAPSRDEGFASVSYIRP